MIYALENHARSTAYSSGYHYTFLINYTSVALYSSEFKTCSACNFVKCDKKGMKQYRNCEQYFEKKNEYLHSLDN